MEGFIWFFGSLSDIQARVSSHPLVGIFCLSQSMTRMSGASPLQFDPTAYNPYDHASILVVLKHNGHWAALGTIRWSTLQDKQWVFTPNDLQHAWLECIVPHHAPTRDMTLDDMITVMLGTTFQMQRMQQQLPSFPLDRAIRDMEYVVYHLHHGVHVLDRNWSEKRRIPWVVMWMVTDAIGDSELIERCRAWEHCDFMKRMDHILTEWGERGMSKLFQWNQLDSENVVVNVSNADLRWFYTQHREHVAPGCMFRIPLHQVDHGTVSHVPFEPGHGATVKISYRELPTWLWERQLMQRRTWHTRWYKHTRGGGRALPPQIDSIVAHTKRALIEYRKKHGSGTRQMDSPTVSPSVLDIEDFVTRAPPCMARAILQDQWVPSDPENQISAPSSRYWLKNNARNQLIRAAAESGYPESFIEDVLLHVRQTSPEGHPQDTLKDLRHLVRVKDQMKYPCMNCEQLREQDLSGLSCVWKTSQHDVAKFQCHSNFIVEHSDIQPTEHHLNDMSRFKKPSFYWKKTMRVKNK